MSLWVTAQDPVELRPEFTEDDLQVVIRSVYRQVLGNAHLLESDRFSTAESLLRNGDINVRQFVSIIANSDLYKQRFFESSSQYRFIELNFKHFLGRAPQDQAEISEHVRLYNEQGYEAEIGSYIASEEYTAAFGENTVPYIRTAVSQVGFKNVTFNRTFALVRGNSSTDAGTAAALTSDLAADMPTKIAAPVGAAGTYANTGKRFRIQVAKAGAGARYRQSNTTYTVGFAQLTQQMQVIQRRGGRILSVTEIA